MAIKSHDETGFDVYTTFEGVTVGVARFEYADVGLPCDEHGQPTGCGPLALWAVRNGFSQALLDTGAGKDLPSRTKGFLGKVDRFRKGLVPSDGGTRGPALSELENELRIVVAIFLRKRGEKRKVAIEKATKPAVLANELGQLLATAKGHPDRAADYSDKLMSTWTAEAQRRLALASQLPTDINLDD